MKHSVNFGSINTWSDWGLLPVQHPVITMPPLRPNLIQLPGLSGEIDLSEAITGYPIFDSRTGQFNFLLVDHLNRWKTVFSKIRRHLHGQRMRLVLEDYPDWYFVGRFSVDEHACDERHGTVVIGYTLEPYMYQTQRSDEPWLWDPFSFVDGVIRTAVFGGIDITSGTTLEYGEDAAGDQPVSPMFMSDVPATLSITVGFDTITKVLTAWMTNPIPGLVLYRGDWLYNGRAATVTVTKTGDSPVTFAITQQPSDVTGLVSTNVKAHVEAVSDSAITYQWQYKATTGNWKTPTTNTFVGHQTATVTIPVTDARNGYQFRCQVTSGGTTITSNAITLTTASPTFAILNQPVDKYVEPGDSVSFVCIAQGGSLSYQWQRKGGIADWEDIDGETSETLTVEAEAYLHGFQYRCVVASGTDTIASNPATLRVIRGSVSLIFRPGRL